MAPDYWIKLYHEIIDDPKMATLPDRLWRRIIELFLLGGRLCPDKSGELPDTNQLAWLLRMTADELQPDLERLEETGIVTRTETGWLINNFQKRQRAATSTERVQQFRKRKQAEQYYEDETNLKRIVTQSRAETESEQNRTESTAATTRPEIFKLYEREIGALTPMIADALIEAEKTYPREWFIPAFQEAADHNARSWKYVVTVLQRWKVEGFKSDKKSNGNGRGKSPPGKKQSFSAFLEEHKDDE